MASNTSTSQTQAPTFDEAVRERFDALDAKSKKTIRAKITRTLNGIYKEQNITSAEEKKNIREMNETNLMIKFMPAQQAPAETVIEEKPAPVVEKKSEPIARPCVNASSPYSSYAISKWQQADLERSNNTVIFNDFDAKSEDSYDEFETMQEYQAHQEQVAQIIETDKDLVDSKVFKLFDCLDESNFQLNSSGKSPMFGFSKIIRSMLGNNAVAKSTQRQLMIKKNIYTIDLLEKTFNWKQDMQRKASDKQIRFLANKDNQEKYNEWIQEFEPETLEKQEKTVKQLSEDENKIELMNLLIEKIKLIDPEVIRENNGIEYNDLLMRYTTITIDELALLIRQTVVRVENNGEPLLFVKTNNEQKFKRELVQCVKFEPKPIFKGKYSLQIDYNNRITSMKLDDILESIRPYITYRKVVCEPYSPTEHDPAKGRQAFNLFTGFLHKYESDFEIDQSIVDTYLTHIKDVLADGDEAVYTHILRLFKHTIMNPMDKTGVIMVIKGIQGTGKNSIFDILFRFVIGPQMAITTPNIDLITGRFNTIRQSLLYCTLDEALDAKDRSACNKFKNLSTADEVQIEPKGKDAYTIADFCNYIIISNGDFASLIEETDRRSFCMETSSKYKGNYKYFKNYYSKLANVNAGKHIFHYLINHIEIPEDWTPQGDIPDTEYKKELKTMQSNSVVKFLLKIYQDLVDLDDTNDIFIDNDKLWFEYTSYCEFNKTKCMSSNPFYKLITKYMRNEKINGKRGKWYSQESLKIALNAYAIDDE